MDNCQTVCQRCKTTRLRSFFLQARFSATGDCPLHALPAPANVPRAPVPQCSATSTPHKRGHSCHFSVPLCGITPRFFHSSVSPAAARQLTHLPRYFMATHFVKCGISLSPHSIEHFHPPCPQSDTRYSAQKTGARIVHNG